MTATNEDLFGHVKADAVVGDVQSVLDTIDDYSRRHEGLYHLGPEKGAFLDDACRRARPTRILEFGSLFGYSALRMVRFLEPGGEVVTVEASPECVSVTGAMLDLAGVGDRVKIVSATSEEAIPGLTGKFDLVFVDHGSSSYLPDLLELERRQLLGSGAFVVADNVGGFFEDAVSDYLEHVRASGKYRSELHRSETHNGRPLADGVELSQWLS